MTEGPDLQLGFVLAYILIVIGVAGSVVPVLPGPMLIWLGVLVWAWADGFVNIGWGVLALLGGLALLAWGSDLFLTTVISRRAGASWRAISAAIGGMWLVEYYLKGSTRAATTAVQAYLGSVIAATIVEMVIAILMVVIFAYRAFL